MKFLSLIITLLCLSFNLCSQTRITDFKRADSVANVYEGYPLDDLIVLSDKLTKSLYTDEEKFRAIYKWICINIEFDYSLFLQNKHARTKFRNKPTVLNEWNKKFCKKVFDVLHKERKTVCTGYAYLLKELSEFAGIKCEMINGYGRTSNAYSGKVSDPNHTWNAVRLDGKWYLCDATWSSGYYDNRTSTYITAYDDKYFLANPLVFLATHSPTEQAWTLLNTNHNSLVNETTSGNAIINK